MLMQISNPVECQELCQATPKCAFFTFKTHEEEGDSACLLFPHDSELILELDDLGTSVSGPRECEGGSYSQPWTKNLDRGRLNLVESKVRHGE